jgi:plastocyanin
MLVSKNTKKKTAMGGVGIALLLCILMALSPMTGLVQNDATPGEIAEFVESNEASEDYFALPEVYEPVQYEYDASSELEGMRSLKQKAFLTEDGQTALLTSAEPMHFLREGSWEEIDLNIEATVDGWEVQDNVYQVVFPSELSNGVSIQVHPNVDPIVTGIKPIVMTLDASGGSPMPYMAGPSNEEVSVGGNVLRFPIAEGFDIDYSVEENQLKQNLVIRERPVLQEDVAWLGLTETMRIPVGHGLFLGEDLLNEELTKTQDELTIRNLETGEVIATIPVPIVMEMEADEPYHATYFIQSFGQEVVITTAVESGWLLDDERQYPLAIDPSVKVYSGSGGYCYVYYANCYSGTYRYMYRYYSTIYYLPWNKYTFTSSNALPTGATIDSVDWKQYVSYSYSYSSNSITAVVMENCGMSNRYSWSIPSASCTGALSTIAYGYGGTTQRKMISSIWNSASAATFSTGTGWKTANMCNSATTCAATSGSHTYITSALANGGSVGMGSHYTTSTYIYHYAYAAGSSNSYLQVVYSGGSDTDAPTSGFVPYSGITSYKEGSRMMFTTLEDMSGIDTTSTGAPHLYYSINNGSYTAVKATTIGTCGSSDSSCQFKAKMGSTGGGNPSITTGDFVNYYWAFQDLASTPNTATDPSGGSGTPSTATAPSTTYWFFVDDVANAGNAQKMTVLIEDRYAGSAFSPNKYFDQQLTYYDNSDEYVMEFDTSDCGTGSNSCFYATSYYFYSQWAIHWTTTPSYGYNGMGGSKSGRIEMHQDDDGYLSFTAKNGPGMNLIYLYDSTMNDWAIVGLDGDTDTNAMNTGVEDTLSGGTSANKRSTYGYTDAYLVDIPGDITGTFGKHDWNATYSSSKSNWMCVGTNGWMYFFRSSSSNPLCTSGYYYIYSASYNWNGFAQGSGYYGRMASTGGVSYKVASVAPAPDTFPPDMEHMELRDSHSKDRTFVWTIGDAGEPPSGLNVSTTAGVGPTMYYRITDADGTVGTWTSKVLSPSDTRANCATAQCDWSTSLEDMERSSSVEYYATSVDVSTASSGTNSNTTSTSSFEVGDPNKVFVVEWHDMGYTQSYTCTYQVLMYDVTNEIEFQYDTNCQAYYDYATVGYQDQTRTKGATLRDSQAYMAGANAHSENYRIGTDSSGHGWETFDLGLATELPTYDVAIAGSSSGHPYGSYCVSSYWWNTYKSGCNANIDLPDGFTFDYFGTEYNGSDSKNRVHIGRMGNMYLKDDGSTALERSITTWYSNMPDLPYSGNSASKPGNIAPWWGYYSSYYCYDNTALDCSVRTRVIPFEGKGTDLTADLVGGPHSWSLIDSPIRVNPSGDYLSISGDLTIEPGVVVQVANGKGISFDGNCDMFTAAGNATDPILFEGLGAGANWKGLAFTGACSTPEGTDDRHTMSYVDFANTTDAAIAAGSRHGSSPSSNANVGNFTMDHVTFTNVGEAFSHGSGQGTVLVMSDFEVNGAADACFNFAEDSDVTLSDGTMDDCNTNGNSWGGAVVNYPGSTAGSLTMENVDISDSNVNLIDVDLENVWISNVTGSTTSAQSGAVLNSDGEGALYVYNLVADGYSSGSTGALDSILIDTVDMGSADFSIVPGGSSSTASGPSGDTASISDFTAGDLTMSRVAPSLDDISVGAMTVLGNAPGNDAIAGTNWATTGISVAGCGYTLMAENVDTDYVAGSCSNSAAPNNIVLGDVDATYTGNQNAIYARNSAITIGDGAVSMPSSFQNMAKASTNGKIVLIAVSQDGTDCDGSSGCDVNSGSSGDIFFGGLATVKVYKLLGSGVKSYRSGHTVQATVVDAGAGLFTVGTHKTDSAGTASAWVITSDDSGNSYTDHNLAAWGPSGQNETLVTDAWYPGSFGAGDSIELRLEPAPVALNGTNMDCSYLSTHPEAMLGYDSGTNTYIWEGKVTMSGDLNIDSCTIIMRSVWRVASDATNSPTLTISDGGSLTLESTSTDTGTLKAVSATYPLNLDMDGGDLIVDQGVISNVAGGINLDSGSLTVFNSSMIYGNAGASASEATIYVNGGTLDFDDSTIMNSGQTGIGLMFEAGGGAVDNIVVKNAATGIYSYNAAPTVNGFTLTDNTVGVDVYGGMSLPTIYRSTLLSGQSTGWTTYAIDLSLYLGSDDYLQVGLNSIYGGGNAHPIYNYATSKYYMIYDRLNVELEDNMGNKWNVTSSTDTGYYDGAMGGAAGAPSWHCSYYGYSYTEWRDYNYFYYLINYGGYATGGSNYDYPADFGFRWEDTDRTPSQTYPMMYWGYYYTSYHGGQGVYKPPEGYNGLWGNYNVCLNYAYSYYNNPGDGTRLAFPAVDISAGNITGATMYFDVLHNRADNYQDRLEVVARTGDDPGDEDEMGMYARESGTPSFTAGTITGADNGIEIGGSWAAANFDAITVTNPTNAGLEVTGSAVTTVDNLDVTGGNYGVLLGAAASGTVEMSNLAVDGAALAGVYYVKDVAGALDGTIENCAGSAIKFGKSTKKDITWSGMNLATNGVGIETDGTGTITLVDSTFANTADVLITGSATVDFIEGNLDVDSVAATGSGIFNRIRLLDISVEADSSGVSGANVVLKNAAGTVTGFSATDNNGDAMDLEFTTITVDKSGKTIVPLSGYTAVTVAKVGSYYYSGSSNNAGDFRYTFDSLSLTDNPGNTHTMDLVDSVDARICYSFTSSSYVLTAACANSLNTGGARTYSSGLKEYGYYGATPTDMSNQVIMMDAAILYLDGDTTHNWNGTTVLSTGSYTYYDASWWMSTYPYGAEVYFHDVDATATAVTDDGKTQGMYIGYPGWNDIVPNIENSTFSGIATVVSTWGYNYQGASNYNWGADFYVVKNSVFSHFRDRSPLGAYALQDMCLNAGGSNYTEISNNTLSNCAVGISLRRTNFYSQYTQSYWGADDAIIDGNTFIDTEGLEIWFMLNSYADGVEITNNVFKGSSSPNYGIYTQDATTEDLLIDGNTFYNSKQAIYMRGATDLTITDNTIYGDSDSSHAGIYSLNGYGLIDGNTLVDADGGILVDGVKYGYNVEISNNDIGQTPGRTAPTAVGIWAEDCGSASVISSGNTVATMENALVTDGCDLSDEGSTFTAIGGSGGEVKSVQINANAFAPENINIKEGDTIRWRANEYYNNSGTGEPHSIISDDVDAGGSPLWSSGGTINLGSTYTRTFDTAGTYGYSCGVHSWMQGNVTVSSGSSSGMSSVGVSIVGGNDEVTLDGSEVSGFGTALEMYGGELTLTGDALLSGGAYGVYAEDAEVQVDGATLVAGSTGAAMHVTGASLIDAADMSTTGLYGLDTDGVDFRWNGGTSDADTTLMAGSGAEGTIENMSWAESTTQIDAGSYVTVTSIGNTIDAAKLIVDSTAVIHEGNLLNLNASHLGGAASDVGVMIKSTDDQQAAYVSPAYRTAYIAADGDLGEWYGNTLNPSDDAMPGVMSGDGSEDFLVSWDANNLYLALTGVDMGTADLQIYIDSSTGGNTVGQSWYVAHNLPFAADYVFWAEDGASGNNGLKVDGFTGWADVSAACNGLSSHIGYSGDTDTEIAIPWTCIGEPSEVVRVLAVVQDESSGEVDSVHPTQNIATGANAQTFDDEITLLMGHSDLSGGDDLRNHLLIYRSYVGSNTPSAAKTYDISVKVDATCAEDWGNINDVDMSTNAWESVDILRACPVIQNLVDVTVDEDSGTYTLSLTDKGDDVQDADTSLTWTVSDDSDPSRSPIMLLDSGLTGQTMTVTPDNDQFGTYVFHYNVVDSHGLSDSHTITWTVTNVNDKPIICNSDRADCMPVFADDGAGNLNVLDEGFGSVSKVLGSAPNATGSYVIDMASNDMANEQPQVYSWGAQIKGDDVSVDPYFVQKKYSSVAALFAEVGIIVTNSGGLQDIDMTGDPSAHSTTTATYTLPTLNNVTMLTYLLMQNGCGSIWYQEYMDANGDKVSGFRSDDGCDSSIDTYANVYSGLNYTDFWSTAYGVDTTAYTDTWNDIFPDGYTTTAGNDPCPAFSVHVSNNELTITENQLNELGGECTIVLSLMDDGGYCENSVTGITADMKSVCVAFTYLIDYPFNHPLYGPISITGCYNLFVGISSYNPYTSQAECLGYSWVPENVDADDFEVNFSVTPVNDAPEVLDWDRQNGVVISDGNGDIPNFPWKVTLTEDDESVTNLTYDLSSMKDDNDHEDADLAWTIVKADTCNYENYFSASIDGDSISFDLIKDATTNAPEWEVDYLNNGGKHQQNPLSGEFCPITLYLHDSATAPSYIPNYGMSTANYQQGEDSVTLYVRVDNVAENVPDYYFDTDSGFSFNGVTNIMTKTYVPTTVSIGHAGDEGPYNYDHMLKVSFKTNGYNNNDADSEGYIDLGYQYVTPPAYGEEIEVSDYVYITTTTTKVWVEMDVLTCVDETCDLTKSETDRYFGNAFPYAHSCIDSNDV